MKQLHLADTPRPRDAHASKNFESLRIVQKTIMLFVWLFNEICHLTFPRLLQINDF